MWLWHDRQRFRPRRAAPGRRGISSLDGNPRDASWNTGDDSAFPGNLGRAAPVKEKPRVRPGESSVPHIAARRGTGGVEADADVVLRLDVGGHGAERDRSAERLLQVVAGDLQMELHLLSARARGPVRPAVIGLGHEGETDGCCPPSILRPQMASIVALPAPVRATMPLVAGSHAASAPAGSTPHGNRRRRCWLPLGRPRRRPGWRRQVAGAYWVRKARTDFFTTDRAIRSVPWAEARTTSSRLSLAGLAAWRALLLSTKSSSS